MDNAGNLTALLERVKAATGPDRELDAAIVRALGLAENDLVFYIGRGDDWPQAKITASIDAALALVEKMLPGAMQASGIMEEGPFCRLVVPNPEYWGYREFKGDGVTQPLAVLAALLTALIEKRQLAQAA